MYTYYVLPLRVFLAKSLNRNNEYKKFNFYFYFIFIIHGTLFYSWMAETIERKLHSKHISTNLGFAFLCSFTGLYLCYRLLKHFIEKYQLTDEQLNNRKLFFFGLFIFIEPLIFLLFYFLYCYWGQLPLPFK